MNPTFQIRRGAEVAFCFRRYCVVDTRLKTSDGTAIMLQSDSKTEVIAKAQELNGFLPVDGIETTYARQVRRVRS